MTPKPNRPNPNNQTPNNQRQTLSEKEYLGIIYYILGTQVYDTEYIIRKEKGLCVGTYENGEIRISDGCLSNIKTHE